MPQRCEICAKIKRVGRQSRHHRGVAGRQWMKRAQKTVRVFKPNLHPVTLNGVKMTLCAKCIKKLRQEQKLAKEETSKTVIGVA
ncbi:MAG TPA: L28 family ribosomal protein [Patescibacteria group bacterium]|nr:L28 family ribosomal protein [Patescibacteria group bacterium]